MAVRSPGFSFSDMNLTNIANLALAKIGSEQIRSIDDANVKEAKHAKLHMPQAIDEVLRANFWGFAMATLGLDEETISEATEIVPWTAAYALPADFLKLKEVMTVDGAGIDKFELRRANSKRCLLINQTDGVLLSYVSRVTDPTEFDPMFTAALVTLLASKLARAISGSDQLESTLRQTYLTEDLPAARCINGHDSQSAENHPLNEFLAGNLIRRPYDFDDC